MTSEIDRLLTIMARLRDPDGGCPWDLEQTFESIAPHTIEEAYEVADAIARGSMAELEEELGDLLFQVVYHARLADEDDHFDFADVARTLADKMVARHPHVFGDAAVRDAAAQTEHWEALKERERAAKGGDGPASVMDGVALGLPALTRAQKLQKRAARVGFDWPDAAGPMAKIVEETEELRAEMAAESADPERLHAEVGDILFSVVNLARKLDVDAEGALRDAGRRFEGRFRGVESALADDGRTPTAASLAEMDALWNAVKRREDR